MEDNKEVMIGAFYDSLKRNNKQIRDDRAIAISEDAELFYKRKIEDLRVSVKKMKRDQETNLDLSPDSVNVHLIPSNFEPDKFVSIDLELGLRIENEELKLKIAVERYKYLFGKEI